MLYKSEPEREQGQVEGGAGEEDPPERRAERLKKALRNEPELRAEYFEKALPHSDKTAEAIVRNAKELVIRDTCEVLGRRLAKEVANTLTLRHLVEFFKARNAKEASAKAEHSAKDATRKAAVIDSAHQVEKGSLAATLRRARLFDKSITLDEVKSWRRENTNLERRPVKFNSWVGHRAREEYQVDLFFFEDLKPRVQEEQPSSSSSTKKARLVKAREDFNAGVLVVDTFSKRLAVVPMPDKSWRTLQGALTRAFDELGGKPGMIYSDADAALTAREMQEWFKRQGIVHSITMNHAPLAERMIGYIKGQIVRHLQDHDPGSNAKWWQVVPEVVRRYNEEHVSRSTHMTPDEAQKEGNRVAVKTNLEGIRRADNPQPRLDAGDLVRVMVKKKFDKGYEPDWSERTYRIKARVQGNHAGLYADVVDPQIQYQLEDPQGTLPGYKHKFMRSELLLVKKA